MVFSKATIVLVLGQTLALTIVINALPSNLRNDWDGKVAQARQEDEDDSPATTLTPINFGQHVATIITGALTGNIDSIIKGSFGFIQQPEVNQLSHNTWESLKGNPTVKPAFAPSPTPDTATESQPAATEAAQPATGVVASSASASPAASSSVAESVPLVVQNAPSYSEYSYSRTTPRAARTTQPTYATLAPLQIIEGIVPTEQEVEEASTSAPATTTSTADVDDEDVDEAEGASGEEVKEVTTEASAPIETTETESEATTVATESYSDNGSTTAGNPSTNVETTTEDEEDQDQFDNENLFQFIN